MTQAVSPFPAAEEGGKTGHPDSVAVDSSLLPSEAAMGVEVIAAEVQNVPHAQSVGWPSAAPPPELEVQDPPPGLGRSASAIAPPQQLLAVGSTDALAVVGSAPGHELPEEEAEEAVADLQPDALAVGSTPGHELPEEDAEEAAKLT